MEICFIKLNLLPLIIFFIVSQATFATDTIRILNIGGANTYIEHRLTKPYTPKTNGMLERVNGKVKANVLDKIKFNNEKKWQLQSSHIFIIIILNIQVFDV